MSATTLPGTGSQTVRIRPHRGWVSLDVRELWAFRELLYFFIWRDVKVRYKQTILGALWAVIQPLALTVVFALILARVSGISPEGLPYPVFAFAGLVPWTLFAQSLIGSSGSIVDASNLLQKAYFPRLLLPIAAIGSHLLDFVIALLALAMLMFSFGVIPGPDVIWLVPLSALALATALAFGVWFSAVNVRYRDVRYALPFLVQVWLLASPVAYSTSFVPADWQPVMQLNPMAGVIEGFRWAVLGQTAPPVGAVLISTIGVAVILVTGLAYFRRVERTFADVI